MRHYLKKTMRPLLVLAVLLALPSVAFAQDTLTFIPLTSIPGIGDIAASGSLSGFLNTLYRICVGAAAVLAAVQIVRAGITQMTSDSVTLKKEARQMIQMALFGLLLVLSPTIVFGVIDPRILNLDIGADSLSFTPAQPGSGGPGGSGDTDGGQGSNQGGGQEGDPSTGCADGYEVVYSAAGETCEPILPDTEDPEGEGAPLQTITRSVNHDSWVKVAYEQVTSPNFNNGNPFYWYYVEHTSTTRDQCLAKHLCQQASCTIAVNCAQALSGASGGVSCSGTSCTVTFQVPTPNYVGPTF